MGGWFSQEAETKRRALDADFRKDQAELGTIDHAVNVNEAPTRLTALTHRGVPLVLKIDQEIVQATNKFPASGHPSYFAR